MKKKVKYIYESGLPFDETEAKIGFPLIRKIYSGKSKYQKIEVFDLGFWGRTLYLDGVLQTTEKDEFIYHEMISQPILFAHPKPERVLVIGGGDGGTIREVLKHKNVKEVLLAELDGKVVEVSQKHLSKISQGAFKDKRLNLFIGDGKEIICNYLNYFDLIILDLPDPSENCKDLISIPFYKKVKKSLRKNGIISVQSGSFTSQPKLVSLINQRLKKVFKFVKVNRVCIPSYQAGEFSLTMASDFNFSKTKMEDLKNKSKGFKLKYWSPEVHFASVVLPKYLSDLLR